MEDVIKANTTVTEYAKRVDMDRVQLTKILSGKTKAPSLDTINRIISGLGLDYELKCEITYSQNQLKPLTDKHLSYIIPLTMELLIIMLVYMYLFDG